MKETLNNTIDNLPKPFRIKVCGMTLQDQVMALEPLGVTFAGFIFYSKSTRYVFKQMTTAQIKSIKTINKVGVFVNTPIDEVLHIVDECGLHMVQLHGDETPGYCDKLSNYISVVKAFRLSDNDAIDWLIRPYIDACDMFMFDTMGVGYGGTGKKFNWEQLKNIAVGKPFFLSGGIAPEDAMALKKFAQEPVATALFAIDINSKFETSPGVKDLEKIKNFLHNTANSEDFAARV
jgi:phosphoribosylanthranilate isomerase